MMCVDPDSNREGDYYYFLNEKLSREEEEEEEGEEEGEEEEGGQCDVRHNNHSNTLGFLRDRRWL